MIYSKRNLLLGEHRYKFSDIPSGIYFVKLRDGDTKIEEKIVIIK
jgi:hypothetical protein